MTINAGVWIDHHKAVVILLTDEREDMLQIMADQPVLASSAANDFRPKNWYTRNDFVAEDKRERKVMAHLNEYYDRVIACVRDAQAIVILGPGEAKGEFRKRVAHRKLRGHIAEMRTAAKLTDAQVADYVRQHFL
jgi:stalled ribosome rescue protein Dom34